MKLSETLEALLEMINIGAVDNFVHDMIDLVIFGRKEVLANYTKEQLEYLIHKDTNGKVRLKIPIIKCGDLSVFTERDVDDEFVKQYRQLFKSNVLRVTAKGVKSVVTEKLSRFLLEYPYTKEQILRAAEQHVMENPRYALNADNFLYHRTKGSQILNYLEDDLEEDTQYDGEII